MSAPSAMAEEPANGKAKVDGDGGVNKTKNGKPDKSQSKPDKVNLSKGASGLSMALNSALDNNKDIKIVESEVKATHEEIVKAKAAFRPNVSLNAGKQFRRRKSWIENPPSPPPAGFNNPSRSNDYTTEVGVQAKQNLFRCGADSAACKEADCRVKAVWAIYMARIQSVMRDVAVSYFTIIAKQKEIAHLKKLVDARKESAEVAKRMLTVGAAKEIDVAQADAATSETESKLSKAEAELVAYYAQFETMTGMPMPVNPTIPDRMFDDSLPEAEAIKVAKRDNPEIIAKDNEQQAMHATVKKITTEFSPSLDVSAGYSGSYDSSTRKSNPLEKQSNSRSYYAALSLTVPIYDGGGSRAEKRKAMALVSKARAERGKVADNVESEMRSVLAAIKAAKQNIISARKAVELRELVLHDTMEEYKAGVKIMRDVLDAQSQLFEASFLEVQAELQYFGSQCRAIALMGRMSPHSLKLTSKSFDYYDHYMMTKKRL
jgi:outer membrane protein